MERREKKTEEIQVTTPPSLNWIPFDLTRQILLSLPAKSLMRFRCVSKLWASVTSDPDFIISFMAHSSSLQRPCLLLNFQRNDKQLFFSLSQHKNLEMRLTHVEKYHLTLPREDRLTSSYQFQSVHGLISFHYLDHIVIWNPSVGQSVTFEKKTYEPIIFSRSYLGYDPIGNTYKLVSMSYSSTEEIHVLTLGAQESWRPLKDVPKRSLPSRGICINGVLFFVVYNGNRKELMSFDVRTENFKLTQTHSLMHDLAWRTNRDLSLVSYKGRLAWVILGFSFYKLWVLEDAEKEEWSCKDFHLPFSPYDPNAKVNCYSLSGVTDEGEFIYVTVSWQDKEIHVSFYDPNRNSNRRIKIERFEDDDEFWLRNGCREDWEFIGSWPDHIENLTPLNNFSCLPVA